METICDISLAELCPGRHWKGKLIENSWERNYLTKCAMGLFAIVDFSSLRHGGIGFEAGDDGEGLLAVCNDLSPHAVLGLKLRVVPVCKKVFENLYQTTEVCEQAGCVIGKSTSAWEAHKRYNSWNYYLQLHKFKGHFLGFHKNRLLSEAKGANRGAAGLNLVHNKNYRRERRHETTS